VLIAKGVPLKLGDGKLHLICCRQLLQSSKQTVEQMTAAQLVQRLEALQFDSHEQARVMIDPGVQAFLVHATKAAAADHLDAKVRHVWRSIKPPPR
jgi:hypothetical protein